jgi:hypothetical protein
MSKTRLAQLFLSIVIFVSVVVLLGLSFPRDVSTKASSTPSSNGPVSALNACQSPASAGKGGTTLNFQWQLMVRADTPAESVLLFTSGSNDALCQAWRDSTGHYNNVVTSLGGFQATDGKALTYEIDVPPSVTDLAPTQLIIGQLPTGTTDVEILTSDQEHHQATLGHGWYLAWVSLTHVGDKIIEIDALGANGINIIYLANSDGLSVGATAAVSN